MTIILEGKAIVRRCFAVFFLILLNIVGYTAPAHAEFSMSVYGNQHIVYEQWIDAVDRVGLFTLPECPFQPSGRKVSPDDGQCRVADSPWGVLRFVNAAAHQQFINKSYERGITDYWDSHYESLTANEPWGGGSDDFALTVAEALARGGYPKGLIFVGTVMTFSAQFSAMEMPIGHPLKNWPDHMVCLAFLEGDWWVLDSRNPDLRKFEDTFYRLGGLINIANYGSQRPNDVGAGFVRAWHDSQALAR